MEKSPIRVDGEDLVSFLLLVAAGGSCVCILTKGSCVGCPGGSGGDLDSRSLGFVALVLLVTMSETLITETYRLQQKGIWWDDFWRPFNLTFWGFSGYRFKTPWMYYLKIHRIQMNSLLLSQTQLICLMDWFLFVTPSCSLVLSLNLSPWNPCSWYLAVSNWLQGSKTLS